MYVFARFGVGRLFLVCLSLIVATACSHNVDRPRIAKGSCCAESGGVCVSGCEVPGGCTGDTDCSLRLTNQRPSDLARIEEGGCCASVLGSCLTECTNPNGCTGNADCTVVLSTRPASATGFDRGECCATSFGACQRRCQRAEGCARADACSPLGPAAIFDAGSIDTTLTCRLGKIVTCQSELAFPCPEGTEACTPSGNNKTCCTWRS